jgi:hypothetical protein
MQWRVTILVWYVEIRSFPYQQLQNDILPITIMLQIGRTAPVSSSSKEEIAPTL